MAYNEIFCGKPSFNKNTFCGTRYLSHCCSLHGTVVFYCADVKP